MKNNFFTVSTKVKLIILFLFTQYSIDAQMYSKPIETDISIKPYTLNYEMLDRTLSYKQERLDYEHNACLEQFKQVLGTYRFYQKPSKHGWYNAKVISQDYCFDTEVYIVAYNGSIETSTFVYNDEEIETESFYAFNDMGIAEIRATIPDYYYDNIPMTIYLTECYSTKKRKNYYNGSNMRNEMNLKSIRYKILDEPFKEKKLEGSLVVEKSAGSYQIIDKYTKEILIDYKVRFIRNLEYTDLGKYQEYEVLNSTSFDHQKGVESKEFLYDIPNQNRIDLISIMIFRDGSEKQSQHRIYQY